MSKQKLSDDIWEIRKDAHLIHHRIADFIIHKDQREHPAPLNRLLRKYRNMMDEADQMKNSDKRQTK